MKLFKNDFNACRQITECIDLSGKSVCIFNLIGQFFLRTFLCEAQKDLYCDDHAFIFSYQYCCKSISMYADILRACN